MRLSSPMASATVFTSAPGIFSHMLAIMLMKLILVARRELLAYLISSARALSRFIMQALAEAPITVYGDGEQTRSFCYITDTVTGLLLLAISDNAKGEVVNVGEFSRNKNTGTRRKN
jgi:hypothetical protein